MFLRNEHLNHRRHTWGESAFVQESVTDEVESGVLMHQFEVQT